MCVCWGEGVEKWIRRERIEISGRNKRKEEKQERKRRRKREGRGKRKRRAWEEKKKSHG